MSRPRLAYLQRDRDRHGNSRGSSAHRSQKAYSYPWPLWLKGVYRRLSRRRHVKDGVAFLKTEKSGYRVEVALPILPVLQKALDAGQTSDLAFICGANGQPLTKETFGNYFHEAANAAGVKKSAHRVRKISATRAANAGAKVAQFKALFGWTDNEMPLLYTQTTDRRELARDAIEKLTINSEY